jgi:type IV secretory pathway ATPase VirB11/archaellum biosynthesis ATPase
MDKELLLEDEDFEQLLKDEQHRELVASIKAITAVLENNEKSNRELSRVIGENAKALETFISKLGEITKPEISVQSPSVSVNQDAVVSELVKMAAELKEGLFNIGNKNTKPAEWVFEIKRNHNNLITSVNAKQK